MEKQPLIPIVFFDSNGKFIEQTPPSHLLPFWFTFSKDSPNAKRCVKIWAENWDRARELMNNFYGVGRWAFQYDTESWTNEEGKTRKELHNYLETEITPTIKE